MIRVHEYCFDAYETEIETYIHPEEIYSMSPSKYTVQRAAYPQEIEKELTWIKLKNGDTLTVTETPRKIARISGGVITLTW